MEGGFNKVIDYDAHRLGRVAYSCTDPNCRDSPLELDNSRLSLDENCLIRGEN